MAKLIVAVWSFLALVDISMPQECTPGHDLVRLVFCQKLHPIYFCKYYTHGEDIGKNCTSRTHECMLEIQQRNAEQISGKIAPAVHQDYRECTLKIQQRNTEKVLVKSAPGDNKIFAVYN